MVISDTDPFSDKKDIDEFCDSIGDQSLIKQFYVSRYNHLDYLWSQDTKEDIFEHIVNYLTQDNNVL